MHAVATKKRAVITGIGVDIVPITRIADEADPEEFLRQIPTDEEIANAPGGKRREAHWTELCATKEAVLKALGCGLHRGSVWHDITVVDGSRVRLSGRLLELAEEQSISTIHVSCSSSQHHVIAVVLCETNKPEVTP